MYTNNNRFEVITHNAWWLQDVWCTIAKPALVLGSALTFRSEEVGS